LIWLCYDINNGEKLLSTKHIKKYDEKRNKIEYFIYIGDGRTYFENTYKYDENRNKIECVSLNKIEKQRCVTKYDENGNYIEDIIYNADGTVYYIMT